MDGVLGEIGREYPKFYEALAKQGPRSHGGYVTARCPCHNDNRASLSVALSQETGNVLLKCHAGCETSSIVEALGLRWGDVMREQRNPIHDHGVLGNGNMQAEACYPYVDEGGRVLYEQVRFPGKRFRSRTVTNGGYSWKLNPARYVLYNLPRVVATRTVYVVEGEKSADYLTGLGLVATTNIGGAGKWRQEYTECLIGKFVAILPDCDRPGRTHAVEVYKHLYGRAVVRIFDLPGREEKQGADDWLQNTGSVAQLLAMWGHRGLTGLELAALLALSGICQV